MIPDSEVHLRDEVLRKVLKHLEDKTTCPFLSLDGNHVMDASFLNPEERAVVSEVLHTQRTLDRGE